MAGSRGKIIVSGFLAIALLVPTLGAKSNLYSAGNAQFEIIGLHDRSVSYVEDLSRHIVEVAERYLNRNGLQFPQRILVSLKPDEYVEFEGEYTVRVGKRGFVNLDLRWEKPLSLLKTCRALSEALMVRYSIYNYGEFGPDYLPEWPATAIGTKAYFSLRPAQSRRLPDWLSNEVTPTLESLLERRWSDFAADVNGYAFLVAMEQSGLERKKIRGLIVQSLNGVNIAKPLASLVQSGDPGVESLALNEWWRASFQRLLTPPEEAVETMEGSRLWIETLADLSNTEFNELDLGQLWNERDNEALRELIEARYAILRLRIVRVNPAYFNAARSLGALFETYLSGDKRHKFLHNLTAFLGDFEDSKEMEKAVVEAFKE